MTASESSIDWPTLASADDAPAKDEPVSAVELSALLAGRMCHDFISPASAIVSGIDLLDDPSASDMRQDALNLIEASARKLVAQLAFSRVAFGGSSSAESFDTRDLQKLTAGVFDHVRASLDWAVIAETLPKPSARALLNLAQIGGGALPSGGVTRVSAMLQDRAVLMSIESTGLRARLRAEVLSGLRGEPLTEGLSGHWVQAYYVHAILAEAGGSVEAAVGEEKVILRARCPI